MIEDIGVSVVGTAQLMVQRAKDANILLEDQEGKKGEASLLSHILHAFQENKDHKESSGINRTLLQVLRQYNSEYDPADLSAIKGEGGSDIFLNITSPKCRETASWLKDILLSEYSEIFTITPTPVPELPEEITEGIKAKVSAEFEKMKGEGNSVGQTIKEINEVKRDLQDAIDSERQKEADYAFKIYERYITDSLTEGHFRDALGEVIEDLTIFPTAILKGPIVTKEPRVTWLKGEAVVTKEYTFMNKRISPFDIYPSPEATCVDDGNFIEYMKMSRKEVAQLKDVEVYRNIDKVLDTGTGKGFSDLIDTNIEQERASLEDKEDYYEANKNVFHCLHFFGSAPVSLLLSWGMEDDELLILDDNDEVDIEAVLIGTQIVKCQLNKDPLGRRPYYTASLKRKPGSFWGESIPQQLRDHQRMCNGCARALSNNMGLSSGPIIELITERLADGFQMQELKARDIIQTTSDPSGGGSRAVNAIVVPSNANELLAVFQFFEAKAEEVTLIPKYARGSDLKGAAATATGMSMLLESSSKGIKDAVSHIDRGIIVPRVEVEFYFWMLKGIVPFTGDINVIAKGSQSLTLKGSQQMRRNEFLQVTANQIDQQIMGPFGRAEILREMAKDLGLGENIIPSRQDLKIQQAKQAEAGQQPSDNVLITQMQLEGQLQMAQMKAEIEQLKLQAKVQADQVDNQLEVAKIQTDAELEGKKIEATLMKTQMDNEALSADTNKQIALSIETGDKMN